MKNVSKVALAFVAGVVAVSVLYANTDYSKMSASDVNQLCKMGDSNACKFIQNAKIQACETNGDVNACFSIGSSYEKAYETALNANSAIEKRQKYGKTTEGMTKTPESELKKMLATAISSYTKVCDKNVMQGCEQLGEIYLSKSPDVDKALSNFEKACNIALTAQENGKSSMEVDMVAGRSCGQTMAIYKSKQNFTKALEYDNRITAIERKGTGVSKRDINWD